MTISCVDSAYTEISQYKGKPTSVPNVPGAFLARPLPKPRPNRCAGCCSKNHRLGVFEFGEFGDLAEVVKTSFLNIDSFIIYVMHYDAGIAGNQADAT